MGLERGEDVCGGVLGVVRGNWVWDMEDRRVDDVILCIFYRKLNKFYSGKNN